MLLELSEQEKQTLLECLNIAVKQAPNALAAASQLLPLAAKISQLVPEQQEVPVQ